MQWYVMLYENGQLCPFNIFDNYYIKKNVEEMFTIPELSREHIDQEMQHITQWQFWSRCEYEYLVRGWPPSDKEREYKVDVYTQLKYNWERFIDYICQMYIERNE